MREVIKATEREFLRISRKPYERTITYISCKIKKNRKLSNTASRVTD
jgi:hypothetical protein